MYFLFCVRYLGHMYMAEALVAMDRIADAVTHLDGEEITDISLVPPEEKKEQDKNGEKDQEGGETKGRYTQTCEPFS